MHCHENLSPLCLISFTGYSLSCEVLIKITMPVRVSIRPSLFSVFFNELTAKQLNEFCLNMVLGNVSEICWLLQIMVTEGQQFRTLVTKNYPPSHSFIHSFIRLAWAECGDSLPFSAASSILPYHIIFPATLLRQLCFHPPSLRPAIYFLVYFLVLLFPNSYTILF